MESYEKKSRFLKELISVVAFLFIWTIGLGSGAIVSYIFWFGTDIANNTILFGIEGALEVFIISLFMALWLALCVFISILISSKILAEDKTLFPPIILAKSQFVGKEYLAPNSRSGFYFYSADDKKLVISEENGGMKIFTFALLAFIVICGFTFIELILEHNEASGALLTVLIILIPLWAYLQFAPTKFIVFDRMTGMVTIPRTLRPPIKMAFKDIFVSKYQDRRFFMRVGNFGMIRPATKEWHMTVSDSPTSRNAYDIPGKPTAIWWSWYVQYMDKNRSLPPGTLLEPYLKKDYERRKAAGFPPPLYKSEVEIEDRYRDKKSKEECRKKLEKLDTEKLKIIPATLLDDYKSSISPTLLQTQFDKLHDAEISTDTFGFYTSVASVFSNKIEGENIDLDSYIKHKAMGAHLNPDYTRKTDDLYNAYIFAKQSLLTPQSISEAHVRLAQSFVEKRKLGKFRINNVFVTTDEGRVDVAESLYEIDDEMQKLYHDIALLLDSELSIEESFYYASFIHLIFVKIDPWSDGNGRSARLIEKWFLAQKLGEKAWFLQSEKMYYLKYQEYYKNIRLLGMEYQELDYGKALPFLLILPKSFELGN